MHILALLDDNIKMVEFDGVMAGKNNISKNDFLISKKLFLIFFYLLFNNDNNDTLLLIIKIISLYSELSEDFQNFCFENINYINKLLELLN